MNRTKYLYLSILCLIFLAFSFFRFSNLDRRTIFDWDQERDAFVIKDLLINHKFSLIGPRVVGPEGFFLGPYFTYLITPSYVLTQFNPNAILVFVISYNVIFFFVSYLVIKRIFSQKIALLFLIFWTINPAIIAADIVAWNPLLVPLFMILGWYFVLRFRWLFLGIFVGLGINIHFQLVFLIPYFIFYLIKAKKRLRLIIEFFAGISFCFLPLLFFDLRHNFLNLNLIRLMFLDSNQSKSIFEWWPVWENYLKGLSGIHFFGFGLIGYLFGLLLILYLIRNERLENNKYLFDSFLFIWLSFPIAFSLFGHRPSEYYFNFLYPIIFLVFSIILAKVKKNLLIILFFLLVFTFRLHDFDVAMTPFGLSYYYKQQSVLKIKEISVGKKINVSYNVPRGFDTGYRYLLDYYQVKQTGNDQDGLIQIVIPPVPKTWTIGNISIIVPEAF
jgi:4-amino-4-deoxy-L-arabinose transferase-like glycosyltransferase